MIFIVIIKIMFINSADNSRRIQTSEVTGGLLSGGINVAQSIEMHQVPKATKVKQNMNGHN